MSEKLQKNPLKSISVPFLVKIVMLIFISLARILQFWCKPFLKSATNIEYMTFLDKVYWLYKSKYPVKQNDPQYNKNIFKTNKIHSPADFKETASLTLSAAGDLINASGLENSKDRLYADISEKLFHTDISLANLEAMLINNKELKTVFSNDKAPVLGFTPTQYNTVIGHKGKNYSILQTACNHSCDFGEQVLINTMDQLKRDRIMPLGTHKNPNEWGKAGIIEKNNIRLGFISATFGLNGYCLPADKNYLVNRVLFHNKNSQSDLHLLQKQIRDCQANNVDFIIASLHWGYEYEFFPRLEQIQIAHELAESGVHLFICHHPHVIQPVEYYRVKNNQRTVPIIYSLGNLTSSFNDPALILSGILNARISKGNYRQKQQTFITEFKIIPVVQIDSIKNNKLFLQITQLKNLVNQNAFNLDQKKLKKIKHYAKLIYGDDW